jgi:hypothetical protein
MTSVKFYEREKESQKEMEKMKQIELMKKEQGNNNSRKFINLSKDKDKFKDSFSSKSIDDLNLKREKNFLKPSYDVEHEKKLDKQATKILKSIDSELNKFPYEKALKFDNRTYLEYYFSLLRTKHLLIFTFYTNTDYNSKIIKISLFIFSFSLYYTINALFINDSTLHKIYINKGSVSIIFQIIQAFYSSIISIFISLIIKFLSLSEKNVLQIKKERNNIKENGEKILKCLLIKFIFYYVLTFLFLFFFWYYISCFCAVYRNTQMYLLKDTLISFGLSLLYPFGISLIPGVFRIISLKSIKKDSICLYKFSKLLQIV